MIKTAEITNFQSHKYTKIEFVPGTNVIIGESDTGKSAVFRAINWVITNRPLGDSFRSKWGGETRVVLETAEGDIVERIKSNSRNEYIVNGVSLKAFGSEVPEQVLDILKIDIHNIQSQMDMPFLLANSPGEAARLLNQAAAIDEIDTVLSNVKKFHDQIKRSIEASAVTLEKDRTALDNYKDVISWEALIEEAEKLEEDIAGRTRQINDLSTKIRGLKTTNTKLYVLNHIPQISTIYDAAEVSYQNYGKSRGAVTRLKSIIQDAKEVATHLKESAHVEEALKLLSDAAVLQEKRSQMITGMSKIMAAITTGKGFDGRLAQTKKDLQRAENEYAELMPDVCPLCDTPLN